MAKTKEKKTRKKRSRKDRIRALEQKIAREKAKEALEGLKTAVKDGRVADDDKKEYRRLLRYMKVMEKAPEVFQEFNLSDESDSAADLRDKLIDQLKELLQESDPPDDEEEDGDGDGEDDEDDDDDDDEDDDDDDEDDDDDDDDDDEDDEDDDDDD